MALVAHLVNIVKEFKKLEENVIQNIYIQMN